MDSNENEETAVEKDEISTKMDSNESVQPLVEKDEVSTKTDSNENEEPMVEKNEVSTEMDSNENEEPVAEKDKVSTEMESSENEVPVIEKEKVSTKMDSNENEEPVVEKEKGLAKMDTDEDEEAVVKDEAPDDEVENVEPENVELENSESKQKELVEKKFDENDYIVPVTWERRLRSKPEKTKEPEMFVQLPKKRGDRTFDCPQCRKTFNSKTGVLNHMRIHDVVRTYTCALCQAAFGNNFLLIEHKRCHRGEDRIFLCKTCKEAFTDHCDYLVHEISHTDRCYYKCIECAEYHGPDTVMNHVYTHYEKRPRSQAILDEWNRRRGLERKKAQKTRIECEECGKVFKAEERFKEHFNAHIGLKPHQCLYCGMCFATVEGVIVHTRLHTKELPYVCDLCDNGYRDVASLKSHRQTHTQDTTKVNDKPKRSYNRKKISKEKPGVLFCPLCNKSCPNKKCLKIHLSYTHNNEADFVCDICDMRFKEELNLKRHFKSKFHKRKEFGIAEKKENSRVKE